MVETQCAPMTGRTLLHRLMQFLHKKVTVVLNIEEQRPVTGNLHAVGVDYIEIHTPGPASVSATVIPIMGIGTVNVTGPMEQVCPGGGMMPGMGGGMPGMGRMMSEKDVKKIRNRPL